MDDAGVPPPTYRRSALQVALLMFGSLGFYIFVWSYKTRRFVSPTLAREDQPIWKTVALIIPIFNFFLINELGERIEGVSSRAGFPYRGVGLALSGVVFFILVVLGRLLPAPFDLIGFFSFVPIAFLQMVLVRAAVILRGAEAAPTGMNPLEWIVVVAGGLFQAWGLLVFGVPELNGFEIDSPWFSWLVAAGIVFALIAFRRAGRQRDTAADPALPA